jgi:hypothetical protein
MNHPFSSVGRTKANMSGRENHPTNKIICRGAPKLRITLRLIAEVVILAKRKVTIWCALPANQLLLYACLQALNIDTGCYTSELPLEEWASIPLSLSIFCVGHAVTIIKISTTLRSHQRAPQDLQWIR